MHTHGEVQADERRHGMPLVVRRVLLVCVGVAMAGAAYLISVRGEALLVDLTMMAGSIFCF